jgi:solute:Na+ symporter, SSS family
LLWMIPAPIASIAGTLQDAGKLKVLDWGVSTTGVAWGSTFTVLTACTGLMLLNLAAYATDQDLVQRSLTCKNAGQAAKSVWFAVLLGIPVGLVFLAIGLLLFVYYQRPELMGAAAPKVVPGESKNVFQTFILSDMPTGVRGLMIAGVLAIGPLGINATLNSMASTLMGDTVLRMRSRRSVPNPRREMLLGRLCVVACGAVLAATSMLCVVWHQRAGGSLIDFALSIMAFAYTGLLAVFLVALLTRRGSSASVIAALVTGIVVTALLQPMVMGWIWGEKSAWPGWVAALGGLASPWRMVIGTGVAVGVCLCGMKVGKKREHAGSESRPTWVSP